MITCLFENGGRALLRHVVVHAVVERDGALLLIRRAPHLSEGDKWGLPGGFLDRDETLTQGVLRELREETGWTGQPDAESVGAYLAAHGQLPTTPILI
jgi:8-oxo-dGTP diphosphatase